MKIQNTFFITGAISIDIIERIISKQKVTSANGAFTIFLGIVRADKKRKSRVKQETSVVSIDYTNYKNMADGQIRKIIENCYKDYDISTIYILHSLGKVNKGEISFFVLASSPHRKDCIAALKYTVNEFKKKVPIWKKENFSDGLSRWVK